MYDVEETASRLLIKPHRTSQSFGRKPSVLLQQFEESVAVEPTFHQCIVERRLEGHLESVFTAAKIRCNVKSIRSINAFTYLMTIDGQRGNMIHLTQVKDVMFLAIDG